MFKIQPVRDRGLQAEIAASLGCAFVEGTYAYFAGELGGDNETVTSLIGMCQFTFEPDMSVIKSLGCVTGAEGDEALLILVRTVMNSVYRAGIPYISVDEGVCGVDFIKSLGFRQTDGRWIIDLVEFFRSPCHYNKAQDGE